MFQSRLRTCFAITYDLIIYAWINVWAFSTRSIKPPFHLRFLVTGGLVFVASDFIYYYIYFYSEYESNSWIDAAYVLGFSFMAISVFLKGKLKPAHTLKESPNKASYNKGYYKMGFEILILLAPILVFLFQRTQLLYFILLIVSLLIYYILINYTQKNIFQEQLLEIEKRNVSELEKKVEKRTEEIFRILNTDFLTGLNSRRYFESKLTDEINNIKTDEQVALLYIDQNKSKAIKHLYGKDTAENLLKKLAETIDQISTMHKGILAAYEDDVFVIMIKGYRVTEGAGRLAEQIITRCNELFYVDNHAIRITLNIGISCYPRDTLHDSDLIKNADIAMMQARTKGFNQIQLYNEKIGSMNYNRNRIEMKLKKVVFDKGFRLHYQPQVYCQSGELCGFESLIRWYEDGEVFISPMDFIPIAEEIGLIVPLGYWIMETAAKQYATWKKETGNDYRISVNVSSKQLIEVDFARRLQDILDKYNIKPGMFEIEITESYQIENSLNIVETLNEIKKLGVSIAIDDFGTGYSSLYYVKNIPTDRIKIAKELIDNIENDVYSNSIIQMAISVAKVKGIKVIAEGVETKEQLDCLRELGCDEIQGYYFSKPLPAEEVEKIWLNTREKS
ncbi:MAG: EAL domain-containing protein [Mobilitalea sp.]